MDMCDELAEIALGWLGWSEEQTLYSDINAILIAQEGLIKKLNLEKGHGGTKSDDENPKLTTAAFDAMFGANPINKGVQSSKKRAGPLRRRK